MENINIDEMFEHYIEKKRAGRREPQGSYNEAWVAGEAQEAELWLGKFGVDTSFETVNPMIEDTKEVKPVFLKNGDDTPDVLIVVRYHDYSGEDSVYLFRDETFARKTIVEEMNEVRDKMTKDGYTPATQETLDHYEVYDGEGNIYFEWNIYKAGYPEN